MLDEKKQPVIGAIVNVSLGGIVKGGAATDFDGNYLIKPLDPGTYNLTVQYTGFAKTEVTGIMVSNGRATQNVTLVPATSTTLGTVTITYKKPPFNKDGIGITYDAKDIKALATTEVTDIGSLTPGVYQSQRGKGTSIGGARKTGTLYIIDGVQVQNIGEEANTGINMSQNAIEQMEVITSGIPAKYGDVSGGVVSITSRGVARKTSGSVRVQQSVDGYNNRLVNFSVAGPLYKKRIDSVTKKPVLGFALSGDWYDDHNRYPTYDKQWVVKDDVKRNLEERPLQIVSDNTGARVYNYSSNYITFKDMEQRKIQPRNRTQEMRFNGKLDYQVADNLRVIGGGMVNYVVDDEYSRQGSLMAPEATFSRRDLTTRGFIRFTQKFGKMNDTSARNNIISNAFYSVQADFQRTSTGRQDPNFKKDIFKYSYVGKFADRPRTNIYGFNTDSISGKQGIVLLGSASNGYDFTRSELNPVLANYTTQYYNSLEGNVPANILTIQANNGMANGDQPRPTYSANGVGLFNSPGSSPTYYQTFNSDQYALDVNASFDLNTGKTRHAIEFGLYYQQRIIRSYAAQANLGGTQSIWNQMRNLVSSVDNQNLRLDNQNPIFRVNGKDYTYVSSGVVGQGTFIDNATGNPANIIPGPMDTIYYNLKNVGTSSFDKNLRKKLGVADNAMINIDNLDPSTFSLDLFSADELLNLSGNSFVGYYGYTYTGAKQTGTVNFNDFWTQKNERGEYTRPIGAYAPTYIAGYIQDRFNYKDINFNIGFRVDRYSANTKVLRDPYSLYPVTTVGQVSGAQNFVNGGAHPSNIGNDYVVYVNDNNSSNPTIIGYRDGNNWYDPTGKLIQDPSLLKQYSDGRDPQPFIQSQYKDIKMTDSNFNPNLSFTDYQPQVTIMPRIQFSFPISDVANFYAHYDIYAQRPYPTSLGNATAWDYFNLSAAAPTGVIANANLRSQKTFDYEVGFQQKLTDHSALTLSAFYKERKDMIAIVPYVYAYPYTYQTYGNRDFSTTKGSTMLYDLRATNHLKMTVSYTLQFAEGTGSSYNSGRGLLNNLIQEGLPNLRYVTFLDVDSRHIIAANADFRFNEGEGPVVGKNHILQNAGANLILRTRSGEPYTRYSDALGQTVVGGVNGARLPWHFGMDLRLDKDFALKFGRKGDAAEGKMPKRVKYVKGIVMINNLLNTREVLGVHGFTGRTDDNGYLVSSFGQQFVPQQISPQSYNDLYTIYMNNPAFLNYARTVSLAVEFNF
ncbi:hypothetical protein GCM10023093_11190 [Nemorincola caseinilytica]|uniref:TonB-dependent receptor plug domain-containing protein n=1 Tax=Nemorincola caseinilytica TaxID=2054315 RepID=A0ABP8N8Z5_9BACT